MCDFYNRNLSLFIFDRNGIISPTAAWFHTLLTPPQFEDAMGVPIMVTPQRAYNFLVRIKALVSYYLLIYIYL